ncbi:aminotransferase class I/II-fold pyridoxal phosphate-dependent enzyme [Candidatus Gracilibacteria bacterium]|nr:aminotransferase class I/II-fold pyridoxal phosphate-dependent enzyme [Candidatus Gracilibacteria bacterium]
MHPEADQLNQQFPSVLFHLFSEKGKHLFSPQKGILKQAAEAKNSRLNATIGIALDDNKEPLGLPSLIKWLPDKLSLPYAPGTGVAELRDVWQEKMLEKNPSLQLENISKPVVTSGLSHGVFLAGTLFLNEGEKILLPDKFWGNYKMLLGVNVGAELSTFPTFKGNGLDTEALQNALATQSGKTVLILNFPNNPSGYSPTKEEADEMVEILTAHAETHPTVVVCDDAYWGLVYEDEIERESLFGKLSHAHENLLAVKLDGATKEDFAWGLRVGFITLGNKNMTPEIADAFEKKVAGAIRSQISMACHPSQMAVLRSLKSPTYEVEKKANFDTLETRYQAVRNVLEKNKDRYSKYFAPIPFNAGYFMCIELIPELNAEQIRQNLIRDFDTGVIATDNMLRVAFSCAAASDIPELFENIYAACEAAR